MRYIVVFLAFSCVLFGFKPSDFLSDQLRYERVREAQASKGSSIEKELKTINLNKENVHILLVAIKNTDELRMYAKSKADKKYKLFKTYTICARSGVLGPKRKQGDGQVPEGFYTIDRFNPTSSYYLSLGISYPNASDLKKCSNNKPGGDIFIHGSCVTIGCLPMTDEVIKEIYMLAVYAKNNGQQRIPVYIFPFEMTSFNMKVMGFNSPNQAFWKQLKEGYDMFQDNMEPITFFVDKAGNYQFH